MAMRGCVLTQLLILDRMDPSDDARRDILGGQSSDRDLLRWRQGPAFDSRASAFTRGAFSSALHPPTTTLGSCVICRDYLHKTLDEIVEGSSVYAAPHHFTDTMSFLRSKSNKEYHRALQSFAESEVVSGEESDDGLDIVESSRKELDLSQYIEGKMSSYTHFPQISLTHSSTNADPKPVAEDRQAEVWRRSHGSGV